RNQLLSSIRQDSGIKVARQNEDFIVTLLNPSQQQTIIYGNYGLPFSLKIMTQQQLYDAAVNENGATFLMPVGEEDHQPNLWFDMVKPSGNTQAVMLARSIKTLYRGEVKGVLMIRISERYLNSISKESDIGNGSHSFITDSSGLVYAARDKFVSLGDQLDIKLAQAIVEASEGPDNDEEDYEVPVWNDGSRNFLVFASKLPEFDLYFTGLLPQEYINAELNSTAFRIIIMMMLIVVVMIVLSSFFAYIIADPLKKVIDGMHEARRGNLTVEVKLNALREVEEVSSNFNEMMDEINRLVINVTDKEKQKRIAELKALQAQINPHFLSNTLNTARWMASLQGNHNVDDLISSLIQLINATIGAKNDMITIEEELDNIRCFLRIQEYRYFDKFKTVFDIEPDILTCMIPRLLLQPLVENALVHGIAMLDGQGTLVIKGMLENEAIRLQVTDNGAGMNQERLAEIEEGSVVSAFNGIGINNVRERIKLNFGDGFGLSINSVPELFTTCEIKIPAIRNNKEIIPDNAEDNADR
ncbi:MAG: sensor histidine kinase, partial [Clostridiaceae bacterium]|nr:sensor histidine kinase [Clostridiaceae bacterium]